MIREGLGELLGAFAVLHTWGT
jgi:hypothetical protein